MESREKIANNEKSVEIGWTGVIKNAEREIRKAKSRILVLQQSIRICQEKLERREPWPEEQSATRN